MEHFTCIKEIIANNIKTISKLKLTYFICIRPINWLPCVLFQFSPVFIAVINEIICDRPLNDFSACHFWLNNKRMFWLVNVQYPTSCLPCGTIYFLKLMFPLIYIFNFLIEKLAWWFSFNLYYKLLFVT